MSHKCFVLPYKALTHKGNSNVVTHMHTHTHKVVMCEWNLEFNKVATSAKMSPMSFASFCQYKAQGTRPGQKSKRAPVKVTQQMKLHCMLIMLLS